MHKKTKIKTIAFYELIFEFYVYIIHNQECMTMSKGVLIERVTNITYKIKPLKLKR